MTQATSQALHWLVRSRGAAASFPRPPCRPPIFITEAMPLDLQYIGISHSLVAVLGWAIAFSALYLMRHRAWRAAIVLGLGVFSHFVLDWISHGPDMPILPDGPRLGLGLWNYPVAAMLVEIGIPPSAPRGARLRGSRIM